MRLPLPRPLLACAVGLGVVGLGLELGLPPVTACVVSVIATGVAAVAAAILLRSMGLAGAAPAAPPGHRHDRQHPYRAAAPEAALEGPTAPALRASGRRVAMLLWNALVLLFAVAVFRSSSETSVEVTSPNALAALAPSSLQAPEAFQAPELAEAPRAPASAPSRAGPTAPARRWGPSEREPERLTGYSAPMHAVAVSSDGTRIATAGPREVRLWDTESGQLLSRFTDPSWGSSVWRLEFSPDAAHLLVEDERALPDTASRAAPQLGLGSSKRAWIIGLKTRHVTAVIDPCSVVGQPDAGPRPDRVISAAFLPDGRLLTLTEKGLCVQGRRPRGEESEKDPPPWRLPQSKPTNLATCSVAQRRGGAGLMCPDALRQWHVDASRYVGAIDAPPGERLRRATPMPDGLGWALTTEVSPGRFRVWLVRGEQRDAQPLAEAAVRPPQVSFGSSWKQALVAGTGLCSWDLKARHKVACPIGENSVVSVGVLSPDGAFAASRGPRVHGEKDPPFRLWSTADLGW
jgi:hypothetical protein